MLRWSLWWMVVSLGGLLADEASADDFDINDAPHSYQKRVPQDRITKLKAELESGRLPMDLSTERGFVTGLLAYLGIPVDSQLMVFSTTSLQLSRISPANPRALYFSEDIYLGYIPGGRLELLSLDPELGAIFYIFDVPSEQKPIRLERSDRCMNCHAAADTGYVPGLVLKSVIPGPTGGSLVAHRVEQTGHQIPLVERFGGWHVTGEGAITNHWGNRTGSLAGGVLQTLPNRPGDRFSWDRYPARTSDLLAHLLLEHQAGFVNRVVEAGYRARAYVHSDSQGLTAEHARELDELAAGVTRYLLFTDEPALPAGGMLHASPLRQEFLRTRKSASGGESLKDLDLRTRLFKFRCSYMIYSPVFTGLPKPMKSRIYSRLDEALKGEASHLEGEERLVIRRILRETLSDLPRAW